MKEQDLIDLGFEKKYGDSFYYYEYNISSICFISNDDGNAASVGWHVEFLECDDIKLSSRGEIEDLFDILRKPTPTHYSNSNDYDLIDIISDYGLNFNRGNIIKYVFRAGKKDNEIQDLNKAMDYLRREIKICQKNQEI